MASPVLARSRAEAGLKVDVKIFEKFLCLFFPLERRQRGNACGLVTDASFCVTADSSAPRFRQIRLSVAAWVGIAGQSHNELALDRSPSISSLGEKKAESPGDWIRGRCAIRVVCRAELEPRLKSVLEVLLQALRLLEQVAKLSHAEAPVVDCRHFVSSFVAVVPAIRRPRTNDGVGHVR